MKVQPARRKGSRRLRSLRSNGELAPDDGRPAAPTGESAGTTPREYEGIARFFDDFAGAEDAWHKRAPGYHRLVQAVCRALVPTGQRVLEIGCGRGDVLASLEPAYGVGVDVSRGMLAAARERHPHLEFECSPGEALHRREQFDYIVLLDLVPYVHDLQALFSSVAAHSHPRTRIVMCTYSNLWRPLLSVLAALRLRPRRPIRNWVSPTDLANLAELAGLELVSERKEILLPTKFRPLSAFANGVLARLPGLRAFALSYWLVARPAAKRTAEQGVSVIVPCRNESGSVRHAVDRIPEMGRETEIIFVEGGSTDDTRDRIEAVIAERGDRNIRLVDQSGKGKWNAVQDGFAAARNEILMILDGDLTVPPEELPKFYAALVSGRGDLITGNRLVYGMESGAMRFLNMLGNRFFAQLLSFVLGQYVKDTLCGTKVLFREDYERIRRRRDEFGSEDPFGDFELLFGSLLLGLKVVNVPVRYAARIYGDTNIRRFSAAGKLLRFVASGYRRGWVHPVSTELKAPR